MNKFDLEAFMKGAPAKNSARDGIDNVRFEGILCSTYSKATNSKLYYSIDENGTGRSYIKDIKAIPANFNLVLDTCTSEKQKPVSYTAGKKPQIVSVIRHIRGVNYDDYAIASKGGATLICDLDYRNKLITVYPAFCSEEDNFDKKMGIYYAERSKLNNICFHCDMKEMTKYNPLVTVIANAITRGEYHWNSNAAKHNLDRSLKKIFNA